MKRKKTLCGKMIKRGLMTEERPCIRDRHSGGNHSPNLEGLRFGNLIVGKRAPNRVGSNSKGHHPQWYILGRNEPILSHVLIKGRSLGKIAERYSNTGTIWALGKMKSEYSTAIDHITQIIDVRHQNHSRYKYMKMYPGWDPRINGYTRGQSAQLVMRWLLENMPKPGPDYQLHVIKSKDYPHGYFAPGHIEWKHKDAKIDIHQSGELHAAVSTIMDLPEKQFQATISRMLVRRAAQTAKKEEKK
jgi:hypothetical protein